MKSEGILDFYLRVSTSGNAHTGYLNDDTHLNLSVDAAGSPQTPAVPPRCHRMFLSYIIKSDLTRQGRGDAKSSHSDSE